MVLALIYSIFIVAFFGNFFADLNIIPPEITILTEILIYILFVYSLVSKSIRGEKFEFYILPYYIFFILCAIVSIIINRSFGIQTLFSLRLIIRFFVFYLAIINIPIKEKDFKKINILLIILFLIQLPSSGIMFYFYGISEKTHGIYGRGGGLTTIIPLIALGFLAGFYIYHKAKKIYLAIGLFFIIYGIVGAKAALLFLYPLSFIVMYYLAFIKGKKINLFKHSTIIASVIICTLAVSASIVKLNPRLNPEKEVGGSIDFPYALQYTKDYTTAINPENPEIAIGRLSTSKLAVKTIYKEGFPITFLGFGPGSITYTIFGFETNPKVKNIKKSYGITGIIYILTEYGILGSITLTIIFCIFFINSLNWFKNETDPYWKAFSFGTLFFNLVFLIIFVSYNKIPVAGDIIPPLYFYSLSIMYKRHLQNNYKFSHE